MRYASITERLANLGSDKWAVHIEGRERAAKGETIIELSIGSPDIPTDPALVAECTRAMKAGRTGYADGRGEPDLLAAISRKYSARTGREITQENVLCFPGAQTALYAVMSGLVEIGDEVLVGDPLYAAYDGVIRASGANKTSVPLKAQHGFRMQASDLEAAITLKSRALLLNTPHNPTGATLSAEELAEIGAICAQHDLWIISDEVYEHLVFDGNFASPFDNAELSERTIAISSISKSHAASGFRSGWAVGPAEFCRRILPISEMMLFGNQPFIADMTAYALTHDIDTARQLREACQRRVQIVCNLIADVPTIRPQPPTAGMHILLDISATGKTCEEFAWGLLDEEGVSVMPGSSFGEAAKSFIRVSLTAPDKTITEACRRIANFARRLDGRDRSGASEGRR